MWWRQSGDQRESVSRPSSLSPRGKRALIPQHPSLASRRGERQEILVRLEVHLFVSESIRDLFSAYLVCFGHRPVRVGFFVAVRTLRGPSESPRRGRGDPLLGPVDRRRRRGSSASRTVRESDDPGLLALKGSCASLQFRDGCRL